MLFFQTVIHIYNSEVQYYYTILKHLNTRFKTNHYFQMIFDILDI